MNTENHGTEATWYSLKKLMLSKFFSKVNKSSDLSEYVRFSEIYTKVKRNPIIL